MGKRAAAASKAFELSDFNLKLTYYYKASQLLKIVSCVLHKFCKHANIEQTLVKLSSKYIHSRHFSIFW